MSVIKKETPKIESSQPKQDLRYYDKEALKNNVFLRMTKSWLDFKNRVHTNGMKRFSIMIMPHTGGGGKTLHISNYLIVFFSVVLIGGIVSTAGILSQGHQNTRNQVRLVVENDALEAKIFNVSQTVGGLSEYFSKFRMEVGSIINSPIENSSIASLNDPEISLSSLSDSPKEIAQLLKLEKDLDVTKEKIFHIGNFMQENQRVLKEIPSIYPLATRARITSRFGIRRNPFDKRGFEGHDGLDLATLPGTPVYAGADGLVTKAGVQGGYGNLVEVEHKYQFKTRYGHLQSFAAQIYPGARVKQGQVIGYVGATGRVTGYHLHYEVLIGNGRVDPEPFAMMLR